MKRKWHPEELMEHWALQPEEEKLLVKRKGANCLGFVLLLKFFQYEGRFPEQKNEIPRIAQTFVADQLGLPPEVLDDYNWQGRVIKYHRAEIRKLSGFRPSTLTVQHQLRTWLVHGVLSQEQDYHHLKEKVYTQLRSRKIEPPTPARIERLIRSAQRVFEKQLFSSTLEKLSSQSQTELNALIKESDASGSQDGDESALSALKSDPGCIGLKSLLAEAAKLQRLRQIALPDDLFSHLAPKVLQRYRLRVETETLTELRQHPLPIRCTLLASFCWLRLQEIAVFSQLRQVIHTNFGTLISANFGRVNS
jgi:hypothetical protein